jgi:hypothetical protein
VGCLVVCLDELDEDTGLEDELAALESDLVVEGKPGRLSAALGRPSVTAASRFGRVGWRGESFHRAAIIEALASFELACPECGPQA